MRTVAYSTYVWFGMVWFGLEWTAFILLCTGRLFIASAEFWKCVWVVI
jgi:hypothetical protein